MFTELLLLASLAAGDGEKPVPPTRPEMKKALEALKKATPRLPLPPLAEEEKGKGRGVVNNGRMRQLYLPEELRSADFPRGQDDAMTLDYPFKTELFWIVSRGNNCQYCLGHQEWKLAAAGRAEERIAALDGDWDAFTPAERAAFDFTRRLTLAPHTVTTEHLDTLKKHYKPLQALEILFTVANNNATNRWTDSLGIPQEQTGRFFGPDKEGATRPAVMTHFTTPTPQKYQTRVSQVIPTAETKRPALESREQVEVALQACQKREPRFDLVDEAKVRELLPSDWPKGPLPNWVRLLANFPVAGKSRILSLKAAEEKGDLDKTLRARLAWVAAREDRAWYALGQARKRLEAMGLDPWALDGDLSGFTDGEQAALRLARKLTATPHRIGDDDIAAVRKHYSDREVAQIVYQICNAAFFNRLTEAAGLPLEK